MKKKIVIFDKNIFSSKKNIILKNSLNYIFFKKLKFLYKKNMFVNYNFYNNFINYYKKNNINFYLHSFFYNNLNFFYIYNLNIFKKQFIFNINFLKNSFKNKNLKFLFVTKQLNKNYYFNNCLIINQIQKNFDLSPDFLENFFLIKVYSKKADTNYFYFLNFNFFVFNLIEYYKCFIIIYLFNINKLN